MVSAIERSGPNCVAKQVERFHAQVRLELCVLGCAS